MYVFVHVYVESCTQSFPIRPYFEYIHIYEYTSPFGTVGSSWFRTTSMKAWKPEPRIGFSSVSEPVSVRFQLPDLVAATTALQRLSLYVGPIENPCLNKSIPHSHKAGDAFSQASVGLKHAWVGCGAGD